MVIVIVACAEDGPLNVLIADPLLHDCADQVPAFLICNGLEGAAEDDQRARAFRRKGWRLVAAASQRAADPRLAARGELAQADCDAWKLLEDPPV